MQRYYMIPKHGSILEQWTAVIYLRVYGFCFVINNALASPVGVIPRVILPVNWSAGLAEALNVQ
jgi:hypothetical protein